MAELEKILEGVGPYLSNLDDASEIILEALDSNDPLTYLEERLRSSEGLLSADIRIILNFLGK